MYKKKVIAARDLLWTKSTLVGHEDAVRELLALQGQLRLKLLRMGLGGMVALAASVRILGIMVDSPLCRQSHREAWELYFGVSKKDNDAPG